MDQRSTIGFILVLAACSSAMEIEIEQFKPDPSINSDNFFDYGTLRLKKLGKNRFSIDGEFEILENCGNEKEISLEVRKNDENEPMVKMREKFCEYFKNDDLVWPDVKSTTSFPEDACPLEKGKYAINNYEVDAKKFSKVPPGQYTARVVIYENGEAIMALEIGCKVSV